MISFKRKINFINLIYMQKTYNRFFNSKNIHTLSKSKITKIFKKEDKKIVVNYKHYVINQFVQKNYQETKAFLLLLKRIIRKNELSLNELELQEIMLLEERIFSLERHIKVLPTTIKLEPGEHVRIKFVDAFVFKKDIIFKIFLKGEFFVTNKRIIMIDYRNEQVYFHWKEITKYSFKFYGFEIIHNKTKYVFQIHDQIALNNTIKNFISKTNI